MKGLFVTVALFLLATSGTGLQVSFDLPDDLVRNLGPTLSAALAEGIPQFFLEHEERLFKISEQLKLLNDEIKVKSKEANSFLARLRRADPPNSPGSTSSGGFIGTVLNLLARLAPAPFDKCFSSFADTYG